MPDAVAEGGEEPPAAQAQGGWAMLKSFASRMLIMYFIMSLFRGNKGGNETPSTEVAPDGTQVVTRPGVNVFPKGTFMNLYVFINELETLPDDFISKSTPDWLVENIEYGEWYGGPGGDSTYSYQFQYKLSEKVQNNGTLYAHIFLTKDNASPNPNSKMYRKDNVIYRWKAITKYKRREIKRTKNLLSGETEVENADLLAANETHRIEISSHFHPNFTVNIVDDHTGWREGAVPQPLDKFITFNKFGDYYPIVYFNDYWNLNSDFMPLNSTVETIDFALEFAPISLFRWQMYAAQSMRSQWSQVFAMMEDEHNDNDQDTFKRALLDTNPYLLGLTIVISLVHTVFEFLAFKNDIQFWRTRESLEGLSVRSVFFNVFQSLIVLLYVLDNETNTVVQISCGVGMIIELWKITKVVHVSIDFQNPLYGFIPLRLEEKSTYTASPTKHYDRLAFKYLGMAFVPLILVYAVYSLVYNEHKGWYSYVLGMSYGFLLTFGFIMMTPQLFINYKMKSVAHLPWRMLTYKALNTFIDDIFAFVIKMPTLYRIGCLRDDVIFFIFLYQKYIYPVDKKRTNEFGVSGEMCEKASRGELPPAADAAEAIGPGELPEGEVDQVDENHAIEGDNPPVPEEEKKDQ
jgi:hypothetical protein